ncbi:hypothetical protein HNY73_011747 [Argiope bruennichi]|uniref:Secreted protein n=1 Tax=Argiope bruennichi TaxID=94029 RepID=A0A8T0ESY6_ARGBR|nr:hypothetical protein HNY73_011747 [Argiope bruennichi]
MRMKNVLSVRFFAGLSWFSAASRPRGSIPSCRVVPRESGSGVRASGGGGAGGCITHMHEDRKVRGRFEIVDFCSVCDKGKVHVISKKNLDSSLQ